MVVVSSQQKLSLERRFSERVAEVGQEAVHGVARPRRASLPAAIEGFTRRRRRRRRQRLVMGASLASAPPATNRRTRALAARSDYRHKTANLPTNDCFSVGRVIRFRAGEIARRRRAVAAHNYRSENFVTTGRRPTDGVQYGQRDDAGRLRVPNEHDAVCTAAVNSFSRSAT